MASILETAVNSYPKIDVKVAGLLELSVTDLEGDGHFIIFMQLLVETLAAMRLELDVVGERAGDKSADGEDGREAHGWID